MYGSFTGPLVRKDTSPTFGSPLVVVTFVYRRVYSWVNVLT